MKKNRSSGIIGVVTEMLLESGDARLERMNNLFKSILTEMKIPLEQNSQVTVNCFKDKIETTGGCNYSGMKLLGHLMKVL